MKTYHLKDLLKKEVLIIELPRLCDYHASPRKLWVKDTQSGEELTVKGRWDVLGKPDEISEEDAKEIVEKVMNGQHFQNYNPKEVWDRWCKTATESLLSAIESEIFWKNPYEITGINKEYIELKDWDKNFIEAESRTFNRSRTLIFVKQ